MRPPHALIGSTCIIAVGSLVLAIPVVIPIAVTTPATTATLDKGATETARIRMLAPIPVFARIPSFLSTGIPSDLVVLILVPIAHIRPSFLLLGIGRLWILAYGPSKEGVTSLKC
jgi:hypothetical protein